MGRIIDMVFKKPDAELNADELKQHTERKDYIIKNLRKFCLGLVVVFSAGALATFGRVYLMTFAGNFLCAILFFHSENFIFQSRL